VRPALERVLAGMAERSMNGPAHQAFKLMNAHRPHSAPASESFAARRFSGIVSRADIMMIPRGRKWA
jgi:hypothetical protein